MIGQIIGALYVGILSIEDAKKLEISAIMSLSGCVLGLLYQVLSAGGGIKTIGLSLVPGLLILTGALISRGKIGIGDGVVISGLGLFIGLEQLIQSLFWGAVLAAGYAGIVLLVSRKKEKEIPFLPFLLAGHILGLVTEVVG